jgi:hypothetical protein
MRAAALAALLVLGAPPLRAEPATDPIVVPQQVGQVEGQAHLGVASAPFDVSALPEAQGQAFVLAAAGRYALFESLSLELFIPLVLGSVRQPAGSYVDAAALGNPQLGARYTLLARRSGQARVELSGGAAVGAPLASYAADLMPNRLLAVADGLGGRGHPERFTPGVLPLTPLLAFSWTSARWSLSADLRLPLLVRWSDASLPPATTNPRSLGFAGVVGAEARHRLSQRLSLAATAHLFVDVAPAVEHVRAVSRVQDFERLSLHIHFGARRPRRRARRLHLRRRPPQRRESPVNLL